MSGYNGNIDHNIEYNGKDLIPDHVTALRNANYTRDDGNPYVWPKDIVPYRIYVGLKGKLEDGSDAPEDDFLARNGFKYGQLYGFATDMSETGPTRGIWRDEWHKIATNGDEVVGKMIAQPWRWDGEVRNFEHDGVFFDTMHSSAVIITLIDLLFVSASILIHCRFVGLSKSPTWFR